MSDTSEVTQLKAEITWLRKCMRESSNKLRAMVNEPYRSADPLAQDVQRVAGDLSVASACNYGYDKPDYRAYTVGDAAGLIREK